MLSEKQIQAKNLFFQTDLTKTQIADLLNVSRRSLHYWVRQNNWERLKLSSTHLPAMLAENCYLLISQYTRQLINETRIMRPVTRSEAETLYKLTLTVKKLKNHSTLNESMEIFAHFMDRINKKNPELAAQVTPFVEEYVEEWASTSLSDYGPKNLTEMGFLPIPEEPDLTEHHKDQKDLIAWEYEEQIKKYQAAGIIPTEEQPSVILSNAEEHPEPRRGAVILSNAEEAVILSNAEEHPEPRRGAVTLCNAEGTTDEQPSVILSPAEGPAEERAESYSQRLDISPEEKKRRATLLAEALKICASAQEVRNSTEPTT